MAQGPFYRRAIRTPRHQTILDARSLSQLSNQYDPRDSQPQNDDQAD